MKGVHISYLMIISVDNKSRAVFIIWGMGNRQKLPGFLFSMLFNRAIIDELTPPPPLPLPPPPATEGTLLLGGLVIFV